MNNEEIYTKLNEIFKNVFMDDSIELKPETYSEDIEDWDSLMQVILLSEIEKSFGFKFNAKEVSGLQNVGEMVDVIASKL